MISSTTYLYANSFWVPGTAASYTGQGCGPNPSYLAWYLNPFPNQPLTHQPPFPPLQPTQLVATISTVKFQPVFHLVDFNN